MEVTVCFINTVFVVWIDRITSICQQYFQKVAGLIVLIEWCSDWVCLCACTYIFVCCDSDVQVGEGGVSGMFDCVVLYGNGWNVTHSHVCMCMWLLCRHEHTEERWNYCAVYGCTEWPQRRRWVAGWQGRWYVVCVCVTLGMTGINAWLSMVVT